MQLSVVKHRKTGQLHKCVLCVAAVALIIHPRSSEAAPETAGSNSYIFKHLCTVVNALDAEPKHKEATPDLDGVLKAATTIKLLFNNRKEVEATADTDGEAQQAAPATAAQTANPCNGDGRKSCREAKKFHNGLSAADKEVLTKFIESKSNIAKEANATAAEVVTESTRIKNEASKASYETVKETLQTALFGVSKKPTALLGSGDGSRTLACGTGAGTPAAGAKTKMAVALLCLCAADSSDCTSCKPCGATNTGDVTFNNGHSSADSAYTALATKCKSAANKHEHRPLSAQLQEAATALRQDLLTLKSTGKKAGFIGGVNSGQAAGACDGKSDSDSGACVFTGEANGQPQMPEWLELIEQAATAAATAEEFVASTTLRYSQLIALNKTLTAFLVTGKSASNQVLTLQQTPTGTQASAAAEKTEKECKNLEKKTDCTKNTKCKWTKPDSETGKYCELNTTAAEQQATQAGTGTGDGAAATKKCKGKPEKDCKSPDCKWEGETCKDSSFLLSKQFTLSVVSAAFVALLFNFSGTLRNYFLNFIKLMKV